VVTAIVERRLVSGHRTLALAYYGDLIEGDPHLEIIQGSLASSGHHGQHEDGSPADCT